MLAALAAARELPQLNLLDALDLTLLTARKDLRRYQRVAACRLLRNLEEDPPIDPTQSPSSRSTRARKESQGAGGVALSKQPRRGRRGTMIGAIEPLWSPGWCPKNRRFAGMNAVGTIKATPLGTEMKTSTLPNDAKYCHNGGMAFADRLAAGPHASAPRRGQSCPSLSPPLPLRSVRFAGKYGWGSDSRPLGAAMRSSASHRRKGA